MVRAGLEGALEFFPVVLEQCHLSLALVKTFFDFFTDQDFVKPLFHNALLESPLQEETKSLS